jgi:hypothetical protein
VASDAIHRKTASARCQGQDARCVNQKTPVEGEVQPTTGRWAYRPVFSRSKHNLPNLGRLRPLDFPPSHSALLSNGRTISRGTP